MDGVVWSFRSISKSAISTDDFDGSVLQLGSVGYVQVVDGGGGKVLDVLDADYGGLGCWCLRALIKCRAKYASSRSDVQNFGARLEYVGEEL